MEQVIDVEALRGAAEAVHGWENCDDYWEGDEDGVACVGHVENVVEDGVKYELLTIDTGQYGVSHQAICLARFYASVNPSVVLELLRRLEEAEAENIELLRWQETVRNSSQLLLRLERAEAAIKAQSSPSQRQIPQQPLSGSESDPIAAP